jgi:hypothetical protein
MFLIPGAVFIKLFFFLTCNVTCINFEIGQKARALVLGRTLQHNVMFAGKARSPP